MQIVIDISDEEYEDVKKTGGCYYDFGKAIYYGTPLLKGHGKIVDVDTIDLNQDEFISQSDYYVAECAIENAPTIIEADKEVEE